MMSCSAHRKDYHRCHKKPIENGLCETHQSYYKDWVKNHPPLHGRLRTINNRVIQGRIKDLRTGRILLTRTDVRSLRDDHADYYVLLCAHSSMNPLWNTRVLRHVIQREVSQWVRFKKHEDHCIHVLEKILKTPEALLYSADHIMRSCMNEYMIYMIHHQMNIQDRVQEIMEKIMGMECWRSTLLSAAWIDAIGRLTMEIELDKADPDSPYSAEDLAWKEDVFHHTIMPIYHSWIQTEKAILKSYTNILKEELVAAVWHPRRVEHWIQNYGYDIFEHL
jgi:hypothetical protein